MLFRDELGDILWDYLNVLTALEKEQGIDARAVLTRTCQKYEERVSGIESGKTWSDLKEKNSISKRTQFKYIVTFQKIIKEIHFNFYI